MGIKIVGENEVDVLLTNLRDSNYRQAQLYLVLPEPVLALGWEKDDEALKHKPASPVPKRPCTIVDLTSDIELEAFNQFVKWGEFLDEIAN